MVGVRRYFTVMITAWEFNYVHENVRGSIRMTLKARIRIWGEKLTKTRIFRVLPLGVYVLYEIKMMLQKFRPNIIFDVGANIGEISKEYAECFPQAQVFCFEPVSSIFDALQRNLANIEAVQFFQLAFSSAKGRAEIQCKDSYSTLNPLTADDISYGKACVENVELDTIDEFCRIQEIDKINLLKIDTEGHDFKVLRGAEEMLSTQRIDILQVEAGMNPKNDKFIPFEEFKNFLENKGYYLFGIYEQVHEHYAGHSNLRRINPVFISSSIIKLNRSRQGSGLLKIKEKVPT